MGRPGRRHRTDRSSPADESVESVVRELYLRYGTALMGFVLGLVEDRGRAEDVVQETMLRGWRNLDRIDPQLGEPRAYLFTVARHLVIDGWRSDGRRPRPAADDTRLALEAVPDFADDIVDAHVVDRALDRLSAEHRAVLDELYFRGATVSEAAHRLGVPSGTVKSRSYYAIRTLRTVFDEMGVER